MAVLPVMSSGPQAWLVNEGAQLHLQHGPVDLLIAAMGSASEVTAAYKQATQAFQFVLTQLVSELPKLRRTLSEDNALSDKFSGVIAQQMLAAAIPFSARAVTPMIAVAGAVADHVLGAMLTGRQLQRVYVNNGGDIALYLAPGSSYRVGICKHPGSESHEDIITLTSTDKVGGVATSGWRGRSHSLGVADAVTVLAANGAMADAAATVIANAIDVQNSPRIKRRPACELNPDSDLADRLVTVDVGCLSAAECVAALGAGRRVAEWMCRNSLINCAYLSLQGVSAVVSGTLVARKDASLNARQYNTVNHASPHTLTSDATASN